MTINADAKVDSKAWVVNALAGYNLIDNEKGRLDLMGGARYLNLDVKMRTKLSEGSRFPAQTGTG